MGKDETIHEVHLLYGARVVLPIPAMLPEPGDYLNESIVESDGNYYMRVGGFSHPSWKKVDAVTPQQYLRRVRFRLVGPGALVLAALLLWGALQFGSLALAVIGALVGVIVFCMHSMSGMPDSLRLVVIEPDGTVDVRSGSPVHAFPSGVRRNSGHVERKNS